MTIALFILAAVSPCAAPTLCPSRQELVEALRAQVDDRISAYYKNRSSDDDLVMVMAKKFMGVSDMVCGDALSPGSRSMNCKYTVRYRSDIAYEVATLSWQDGKWVITETHDVWRKRR